MNGTFVYIIAALLATALASLASFGGDNERWVRFALGVVLTAAISGAIFDTVAGISLPELSIEENVDYGNGAHSAALSDAFCAGIRKDICERYGLLTENVTVSAEGFEREALRAEHITVTLDGRAVGTDTRGIRAYVTENFGECEVILCFE